MPDDEIISLAYTAREINKVHTNLEVFNTVLLSDLENGDRVRSCLGCFDSIERAYAYHTKTAGSLGEKHSVNG